MAEQPKPFMRFYLVKDGTDYRIDVPSEKRLVAHQHAYSYDFDICEIDDDKKYTLRIQLTEILCAEKSDIEQVIIAVRALYGLLGTSDELRELGTNFPPEFLSFEKVDAKKTRQEILSYAQQRDDVLFDQPFHVIEFISAIHTNPRELVRQLQFWVSKNLFAFDVGTSFLASKHEWADYIFKRMQLDKNLLQNTPLEINRPDKLVIGDDELATLSMNNHRYYKLLDTSAELDGDFAFVLMPFNEDEFPQDYFQKVVQPTVEDVLDIRCVRVDMDKFKNFIESKIYTHLIKSEFVIAELSTENPNVVFELGQAFAFEREIIPTYYNKYGKKDGPKLSFDYRHYDTIFYDDYEQLEKELRETLEAMKRRKEKST